MPNPPIYHDLIAACAQSGCPVCRLAQQSVMDHIRTLLSSESLIDPKIRQELRQALGFCPSHTWLMMDERLGDALGVSILYQDILKYALKQISEQTAPPSFLHGLARRLKRMVALNTASREKPGLTPAPCLACQMRDSTEALVLGVLVDGLADAAMRQALSASSSGLCLPHLSHALEMVPNPQAHQTLFSIGQERLEALRQELGEYIRKNDYRFREEPVGAEGHAWKRSTALTVGEKGIR